MTLLVLSQQGDSFRLYTQEQQEITEIIANPLLVNAATCKTHEQVLTFLQNLEQLYYSPSKPTIELKMFHVNSPNHAYHIGNEFNDNGTISHSCPINKMIFFVAEKITQKALAKL
jgi:hypothetical protein